MSQATKAPRCEVQVERRIAYPCALLTAGQPARITINGRPYCVYPLGEAPACGWRIIGAEGRTYDIHPAGGVYVCDCPDATYRARTCKHCRAIAQLRADGAI